ncbi:atrophin-1-like isoform X2 [Diprion similis]|uniref:atrophin-1-like isoform X2 n=1 Tax=Diprion similis TaxID=362088 RepID=UPI001EF76238|nr:atrophin-1-like isoform X2 [Diprion similis]
MSSASTGGTEGSSPASSPASAASLAMAAPKYGTLVPNRIFVGGISANTSEAELAQLFSTYGNVKATKIISDRAGVSKGYGFVTFETEEEAKRLQQESECIVLRERKLNIAPAIKKQPFNRSYDGSSGSPPAVPTNTYYYTNGMGLTYQNGMTFYNAGAPAPATPVAPPADPATIYQATSVFGPQATAGHQTFAPVMYPCPAPSLYVPQQYQYTPMSYEPYYTGATAAGAPQYLYTASSSQSTTNGGGTGSGGGTNGATSPPAGPPPALTSLPAPPQPQHFYTSAAPPPHHHPQIPAGPPQSQFDHVYYSCTAGPPPLPPSHASIGLTDQQLLLYATDGSCQSQQSNDTQAQPQEPQHGDTSGSVTPLVPLVPIKFPITNRYPGSYHHPVAIHTTNLHGSQTCLSDNADAGDAGSVAQMHCRTIVYHPAAVYIPHTHSSSQYHPSSSRGPSLLPTPTSASSHHHHHHHHHRSVQSTVNPKLQSIVSHQRDYSKAVVAGAQGSYNVKSQNLSIALISSSSGVHNHGKLHGSSTQGQKYANASDFHKLTSNVLSTTHFPPQHQLAKRSLCANAGQAAYFSGQRSGYGSFKSMVFGPTTGVVLNGLNYPGSQKLTVGHQNYGTDQYFEGGGNNSRSSRNYSHKNQAAAGRTSGTAKRVILDNNNCSNGQTGEKYGAQSDSQNVDNSTETTTTSSTTIVSEKSSSPPPAPYSPMTRPLPNLSPPVPQVQFYAPAQNRYQTTVPSSNTPGHQQQQQQQQQHQHQHQQQPAQRRYTVAPPLPAGRKPSEKYSTAPAQSSMLRQHKYKPNGMMQSGSKSGDDSLGGAGDAPPGVGRMPITPPGTPRNTHTGGHSGGDQNQISDCTHQMQALSL